MDSEIFRNILLCYDDRPSANPQNVIVLKKRLVKMGYQVFEYSGQPFKEDSTFKIYGIDQDTMEKVNNCIAMVICCSIELKHNLCCKTLTRYARTRRESTTRSMPELLFTMMQGSYTTQSFPFTIDGWLKWFVKDTLWYPMWNRPYIKGASEAIPQAIMLKRRQISVDFGPDLKRQSVSQKSRSVSRSPSRGRSLRPGTGYQSQRSLSPSAFEGLVGVEPEESGCGDDDFMAETKAADTESDPQPMVEAKAYAEEETA